MTWALDSISEESSAPKAGHFPLEEGVVWNTMGEVFLAHNVSIMKDGDSVIGAHYQNIFGGRHGCPAALVFAVRARGCPYISLTNFNLSKKKKKNKAKKGIRLYYYYFFKYV